jgi:hypothetical protein
VGSGFGVVGRREVLGELYVRALPVRGYPPPPMPMNESYGFKTRLGLALVVDLEGLVAAGYNLLC